MKESAEVKSLKAVVRAARFELQKALKVLEIQRENEKAASRVDDGKVNPVNRLEKSGGAVRE